MKVNMKKYVLTALLFFMLLAVPVSANAASSSKTQVKKSVNTFFKYAQNMETKKMEKCFVNHGNKIFVESKSFYGILKPFSRKMEWKIKKVQVKGKNATVKLRVDFESLNICYWNCMVDLYQRALDGQEIPDDLVKHFNKTLKKEIILNGSESMYSNITVKLKKVKGKWKIAKPTDSLMNVLYCDLIYTIYEFTEAS